MRGVLGILLSGRVERDHHAPEAARRRGGSGHGRRQFNKLLFVYIPPATPVTITRTASGKGPANSTKARTGLELMQEEITSG